MEALETYKVNPVQIISRQFSNKGNTSNFLRSKSFQPPVKYSSLPYQLRRLVDANIVTAVRQCSPKVKYLQGKYYWASAGSYWFKVLSVNYDNRTGNLLSVTVQTETGATFTHRSQLTITDYQLNFNVREWEKQKRNQFN